MVREGSGPESWLRAVFAEPHRQAPLGRLPRQARKVVGRRSQQCNPRDRQPNIQHRCKQRTKPQRPTPTMCDSYLALIRYRSTLNALGGGRRGGCAHARRAEGGGSQTTMAGRPRGAARAGAKRQRSTPAGGHQLHTCLERGGPERCAAAWPAGWRPCRVQTWPPRPRPPKQRTSPWCTGSIVTAAIFRSSHASTPAWSSAADRNAPSLVRVCCPGSGVSSGRQASPLASSLPLASSTMWEHRAPSIKFGYSTTLSAGRVSAVARRGEGAPRCRRRACACARCLAV